MNYPENIITSEKFKSSRSVLGAKMTLLKSQGKGNKPNKAQNIDDAMVSKMWKTGQ